MLYKLWVQNNPSFPTHDKIGLVNRVTIDLEYYLSLDQRKGITQNNCWPIVLYYEISIICLRVTLFYMKNNSCKTRNCLHLNVLFIKW